MEKENKSTKYQKNPKNDSQNPKKDSPESKKRLPKSEKKWKIPKKMKKKWKSEKKWKKCKTEYWVVNWGHKKNENPKKNAKNVKFRQLSEFYPKTTRFEGKRPN